MASNVLVSKGTTISIKIGSTLTKISGVTNITGLGSGAAPIIDTTDLDSESREKQLGTPDEGQIKIDFNYIPDDAGQLALIAARASREAHEFALVARKGSATYTWTFDALVPTVERGTAVDAAWTGSATLEITGAVTEPVSGA